MADGPMPSVVICGGGVIGCATAYSLARRGVRSVIVEADGVASGASGAAAGLLSPPTGTQLASPLGVLIQRSLALHRALAGTLPAESGVDYQFAEAPLLRVAAGASDETAMRDDLALLGDASGGTRWLGAAEARRLCPLLGREVRGGVWQPAVAQVDPYRFTLALLHAAETRGATLRSGRVAGVRTSGGRVIGVDLAGGGSIPAEVVIIAMGPWSSAAAPWIGAPVPVTPLKGQIVKLRPRDAPPQCGLANTEGNYLTPKPSGLIYAGTTEETVGFDTATTATARERILAFALDVAPHLSAAAVVEQTACLRPLSADGLPLIGAVPGLAGAYVATGHGRKGILLAPATGQALAELIVDGRARCVDLAPFAPARFAATSRPSAPPSTGSG